jgi:hypothetical protein
MEIVKATTFTLFPKLPSELRLKIWRLAAPGPRTVPVEYRMKYDTFEGKRVSTFSGWRSSDPVPVILHICHEARDEALKSYQPAFGSYFQQPKIYINFDIDTVLFGMELETLSQNDSLGSHGPSDYLLELFLGGDYHGANDGEKIQRMVLDINESLYGRRAFCWDEIRPFENLKELTVRSWDEDDMADVLMRHFRGTLGTVAGKHPDWAIPGITAVSAISRNEWGRVEVPHVEQSVA